MKKFFILFVISFSLILSVQAQTDKISEDYLKNKKHLAISNPLVENIVEKAIKKSLKKEIGKGKYKVKFEGYTLLSMKKGIFKFLEIIGKNIVIEDIPVPYLKLKTISDYNWIDYRENPITIKTNTSFYYELELDEDSISKALDTKNYQKQLDKVNNIAYPLFRINDVKVRIRQDKTHIIIYYTLPLSNSKKNKTFMVSTDFKVDNGKVKASNVAFDSSYGKLPLDKVSNLVNLINPLNFTLDLLKDEKCKGQVENVKIVNNILKINGRIFIEAKKEGSK